MENKAHPFQHINREDQSDSSDNGIAHFSIKKYGFSEENKQQFVCKLLRFDSTINKSIIYMK